MSTALFFRVEAACFLEQAALFAVSLLASEKKELVNEEKITKVKLDYDYKDRLDDQL